MNFIIKVTCLSIEILMGNFNGEITVFCVLLPAVNYLAVPSFPSSFPLI
jgi:hypothetical protein